MRVGLKFDKRLKLQDHCKLGGSQINIYNLGISVCLQSSKWLDQGVITKGIKSQRAIAVLSQWLDMSTRGVTLGLKGVNKSPQIYQQQPENFITDQSETQKLGYQHEGIVCKGKIQDDLNLTNVEYAVAIRHNQQRAETKGWR